MKVYAVNFILYLLLSQKALGNNRSVNIVPKFHHIKFILTLLHRIVFLEIVKTVITYFTHIANILNKEVEIKNFG